MSVPDSLRAEVKSLLWAEADRLNWTALQATEKARWYELWTSSPQVGQRLAPYLDPRKVRVYIKDTLLKDYTRDQMADHRRTLALLGIGSDVMILRDYIKPHGRLLSDKRQIAWSKATDWKLTLMALHERSFQVPGSSPYGAVLFDASVKHGDPDAQAVVMDAARKLGIERIRWIP